MKSKKHILIVDDEELNRDILKNILEEYNFSYDEANDGQQALQKLRSNKQYDLILLDKMMPNLDGLETLKKIKAEEQWANIPVIMQSAANAAADIKAGIENGAYYYLIKPFEEEVLMAIVSSALQELSLQKSLQAKVDYSPILEKISGISLEFRTLEDIDLIAGFLAAMIPEKKSALSFGLREMMINAVEHGNLEISYQEKSTLNYNSNWEEEVKKRLQEDRWRHRIAEITAQKTPSAIVYTIKDQGEGFDWQQYMEISPTRVFDNHGRGIAFSNRKSFSSIEYVGKGNEVICTIQLSESEVIG